MKAGLACMRRVAVVLIAALILVWVYGGEWLVRSVRNGLHGLAGGGCLVEYYDAPENGRRVARRWASGVVRDYGEGRPALGVPRDGFLARWHGWLIVPVEGDYEFFLQSVDGSRFLIDGQTVIDHWSAHRWTPGGHGASHLTAGCHAFAVEHFNRQGRSAIRLRWKGGSISQGTTLSMPYIRWRNSWP